MGLGVETGGFRDRGWRRVGLGIGGMGGSLWEENALRVIKHVTFLFWAHLLVHSSYAS